MLKIKMLYREPTEAEYKELKVFDSLDEYLKVYNEGKDFVRTGYENWNSVNIDGKKYYVFKSSCYGGINYDDLFITEKVYKDILKYSKKKYKIHESNLFRTGKNSNCRYTGDLGSAEEVINYIKDDARSWLPQIIKEIDEDIETANKKIEELKKQILKFEEDKLKIQDEEYLKSRIELEYEFDSAFYKQIKNLGKVE